MQGEPALTAGVQSIPDFVNGFPASLESEGVRKHESWFRAAGSNTWLVGLSSHPTIGQRALVGESKSKSNTKIKTAGEEESQKHKQNQPLTPTPKCA